MPGIVSRYFTYVFSFNPYKNPTRQVQFSPSAWEEFVAAPVMKPVVSQVPYICV